MSRILAIDWDRKEARALLLNSGPTGTSVVGVWAARLEAPDGVPLNGKQVGARLAEVMGADAVGKATTIVGVGRDNVQIKLLALPPAPENELPDLVRFQAEREFTALGVEAALDYIPLSGSESTPHTVLAVALSPAGINEAREVAQAAGLETDRITVRALAAVSFAMRAGAVDSSGIAIVVNPIGDEADLSIVDGGKVVLLRTVRLPDTEQAAARQRSLTGEIRRTIAAARQQSADRSIDKLVLCGNSAGVDKVDGLGEDLGIPVMLVDPVANAPSGLVGSRVSAESLSRFSAVLGMALSEADRKPPIVDFLNVRRKVEKQRFTRTHAIAAAAAAVVLLAVVGLMWRASASLAGELADLQTNNRNQEAELKKLEPFVKQYEAVAKWKATDANWLEVLGRVSETLRPKPTAPGHITWDEFQADRLTFTSKDVFVNSLLFVKPGDGQGGEVQLTQALARSSTAATELQARVRNNPRLQVKMDRGETVTSPAGYGWRFSMKVDVEARDEPVVGEAPPTDTKSAPPTAAPTADGKNVAPAAASPATDAKTAPPVAVPAATDEKKAEATKSTTEPPTTANPTPEAKLPLANGESK